MLFAIAWILGWGSMGLRMLGLAGVSDGSSKYGYWIGAMVCFSQVLMMPRIVFFGSED